MLVTVANPFQRKGSRIYETVSQVLLINLVRNYVNIEDCTGSVSLVHRAARDVSSQLAHSICHLCCQCFSSDPQHLSPPPSRLPNRRRPRPSIFDLRCCSNRQLSSPQPLPIHQPSLRPKPRPFKSSSPTENSLDEHVTVAHHPQAPRASFQYPIWNTSLVWIRRRHHRLD